MASVTLHHSPKVVRWFIACSRAAGLLIVTVALAVLAGWWWDLPVLTSVVPGQPTMNASTAIGLVLAGLALLASLRPGLAPGLACKLLSLAVFGLGAANLTEYAWSVDLGINHLFEDPNSRFHSLASGKMSPYTAVAFMLLGGLGFLTSARRWPWLREAFAVGLLAIALAGLAFYGSTLAGQLDPLFNPLVIHTAVLLLVAALGWMSSVPTTGLTRVAAANTLGGSFARRLLLPSLVLPVAFTFVFKSLQSQLGASEEFALMLAALFTSGTVAWMIWWVAELLDRVERQRQESESLRDDANTDVLTGLANRRAFDAALDNLLRGRREKDTTFSLLMLDLDKFKAHNDDFGHQAGDEALRNAGQILRSVLRPSDQPARYGGEELALLLPGADAGKAGKVAERLLKGFRSFTWPLRPVTVSIGVAEAIPGEGAADLIQRADAALYQAKHAGRDRAVIADAGAEAMPTDADPMLAPSG